MTELKNDRFLRALMREPVDRDARVDDAPGWVAICRSIAPPARGTAGAFLSICARTGSWPVR